MSNLPKREMLWNFFVYYFNLREAKNIYESLIFQFSFNPTKKV